MTDLAEWDRRCWAHIAAQRELRLESSEGLRETLADEYADLYIARLREQFAADEIDLDTFEATVAAAIRGFIPVEVRRNGRTQSLAGADAVLKAAYELM